MRNKLKIRQSIINQYQMPLFAHRPEIHDRIIRTKGSFQQVMQSIRNSQKLNHNTEVNIILYDDNSRYFTNILRLVLSLNIENIIVTFFSLNEAGTYNSNKLRIKFLRNKRALKIFYQDVLDIDFSMYIVNIIKDILDFAKLKKISVLNKDSIFSIFKEINDTKNKLITRDKKDNILENSKEVNKGEILLSSYPTKITIELTSNCNSSCIMCTKRGFKKYDSYNPGLNMSFGLFKKIANTLFPYARYVDLRGYGESTILPNFLDFIDYTLRFGCRIGLITNCSVRDDKIWQHLVKNKCILGISIDGATQKTYERIRKGLKFKDIIHNLELISRSIHRHKSYNNTYFLVTVQEDNILELEKIINLASKFSIRHVQFNPVRGPMNLDNIGRKIISNKLKKALRLAECKGIRVSLLASFGVNTFAQESKFKSSEKCFRAWSNCYITYDGKIGPCNHKLSPRWVLGDFCKDCFETIWNNLNYQFLRSTFVNNKLLVGCQWCKKNRYYYDKITI